MVARGWGVGGMGVTANAYGLSLWGDANVLKWKSEDGCTVL